MAKILMRKNLCIAIFFDRPNRSPYKEKFLLLLLLCYFTDIIGAG